MPPPRPSRWSWILCGHPWWVLGETDHVWAQNKADWIKGIVEGLDVPFEQTAGIGDSDGYAELLRAIHLRFSVGRDPIRGVPGVTHLPGLDIRQIASRILDG